MHTSTLMLSAPLLNRLTVVFVSSLSLVPYKISEEQSSDTEYDQRREGNWSRFHFHIGAPPSGSRARWVSIHQG